MDPPRPLARGFHAHFSQRGQARRRKPERKAGWLHKQPKESKDKRFQITGQGWKRRYFVLEDGVLSYYDKEWVDGKPSMDSKPYGVVEMGDAGCEVRDVRRARKGHPNAWVLEKKDGGTRILKLVLAPDEGAMEPNDTNSWKDALNEHLHYYKDSAANASAHNLARHLQPSGTHDSHDACVFFSYRQDSDIDNVERMVDKLGHLHPDVATWWDQKDLKPGEDFVAGFVEGLLRSDIYVPILSKQGLSQLSDLDTDSGWIDNFFLEMRLALELKSRGDLTSIFPILIGNLKEIEVKDTAVQRVEDKVREILKGAAKGDHLQEPGSVEQTLAAISKRQGYVLQGDLRKSIGEAVEKIAGEYDRVKRERSDTKPLISVGLGGPSTTGAPSAPSAPLPPPPPAGMAPEHDADSASLAKLKKFLEQGLITQMDYDSKKQVILERM